MTWYTDDNVLCVFRGQMISQEDYNFITRLDNSSPEQRVQLLKEKPYQVRHRSCCCLPIILPWNFSTLCTT